MVVVVAAKEAQRVGQLFSVVLEMPHPFGPIFRLHAAGLGPTIRRVELAMPLQGPQFLESDLPNRPIQEQAVYATIVAVDAHGFHEQSVSIVVWRRLVGA